MVDLKEIKNILGKLNFSSRAEINKNRWSAKNNDYEICLDLVDKLGLFVEVEVKEDKFLAEFKNKLTFSFEEMRDGSLNLYAKDILHLQIPNFNNKFKNNPDWNFLPNQKDLVYDCIKKDV